jgi:hypothetical protein
LRARWSWGDLSHAGGHWMTCIELGAHGMFVNYYKWPLDDLSLI